MAFDEITDFEFSCGRIVALAISARDASDVSRLMKAIERQCENLLSAKRRLENAKEALAAQAQKEGTISEAREAVRG